MPRLVLAGGSGFLGAALAREFLAQSWDVVNLTRSPRRASAGLRDIRWDGRTAGDWVGELDGAAAVVNLTGRSVDCRYHARNRAEILDSRLHSVAAIGAALRRCAAPPPLWIQAASLAIYGDAGDRVCEEDAPHGAGFSVTVCERWEQSVEQESAPRTRKTVLRIGFVLGREGGALEKLARLARLGLGGTVGSGRQWISWLHIEDFNRLAWWLLNTPAAAGVYNVAGPCPVQNREFMRELRRALGVWFGPPAPALAVHLGSVVLRTEASLALTGRRCLPARLTREGFEFRHTDLRRTLEELLR